MKRSNLFRGAAGVTDVWPDRIALVLREHNDVPAPWSEEDSKIMTRWNRYYRKQTENENVRRQVEEELANLRLGTQIAKLRRQARLSQTQLAAKAKMSAPEISDIESNPSNVKVGTLARIAQALDSELEIRFKPCAPAAHGARLGSLVPRCSDFKRS